MPTGAVVSLGIVELAQSRRQPRTPLPKHRVRVQVLAAELGCSRRYLLAKFREQVGRPPKTGARLLRFSDVRRRIERDPRRWAEIAFAAGYVWNL